MQGIFKIYNKEQKRWVRAKEIILNDDGSILAIKERWNGLPRIYSIKDLSICYVENDDNNLAKLMDKMEKYDEND